MYKVILVDDEPWTLLGIKNTFQWETYGFEIIGDTTEPLEALELIVNKKPDVVISDIKMPELSGINLLKLTREKNIHSKFVFISGYADFNYAQEAIKYEVVEYCLKPIKQSEADRILAKLKKRLDAERGIAVGDDDQQNVNQDIENVRFKKMIAYINQNLEKKLFLKDLADEFNINSNYCCFLFKKNFDCNFSEYIMQIRMNEAKNLLKDKSLSINEIAEKVGCDYYYFNKVFKNCFGTTPYKFRSNLEPS